MNKQSTFLFNTFQADFFKVYFPTLFIFILILANQLFFPNIALEQNAIYFFVIAFFIDAGHVFTTFLESYTDSTEIKKHHTLYWTLLAFILNLLFLVFFSNLFFYYIFYFTVFHNMRQGLGFSFIYQKKLPLSPTTFKILYYLCTMVPFILFHFKPRSTVAIGENIIQRLDLFQWLSSDILNILYFWGQLGYALMALAIIAYLIYKKIEVITPFIFFALVYAVSFLVLNNEIYAYSLLIVSHGIPYFFLMEKRISLTHPKRFIKKYAFFLLLVIVSFGAMIDFMEDDIYEISDGNLFVQALFYTPLIAHFLIDGVIWKRGHEKFETLKRSF